MSKIGKQPITIPSSVSVTEENNIVTISKNDIKQIYEIPSGINIQLTDDTIIFTLDDNHPELKAKWGLYRSLVSNAIIGFDQGFSKKLEINGIGYRVELQNQNLKLALGYSHPIIIEPPKGIEFNVEGNNGIIIKGYDKQVVGQVAAKIRAKRPPEPYKGKGIKYSDEIIRRKQGKSN